MTMRRLAFATLLLWAATLAMPVAMSIAPDGQGVDRPERVLGALYMLFGPLGPLAIDSRGYPLPGYEHWPRWTLSGQPLAAWGWYAHPFWAWCTARMLRGRRPRPLPALFAAALGLVALQPHHSAMDDRRIRVGGRDEPAADRAARRMGERCCRPPHAPGMIKRRRARRSCRPA
jgi:hypothetical protein